MNLKVGDQLILFKGGSNEQVAQVMDTIDADKFYNYSGGTEYLIKTMKSGNIIKSWTEIDQSDNIDFYKPKEERDFNVMEEFEHIL